MRLIDADDALERLKKAEQEMKVVSIVGCKAVPMDGVIEFLETRPIVDAAEVVRCKDCRWAREKDHREPTDTPRELICQCFKHHYIPAPWGARMAVSPDDFCSYGERKTDG